MTQVLPEVFASHMAGSKPSAIDGWARSVASCADRSLVFAEDGSTISEILDVATKRDADWLIAGSCWRSPEGTGAARILDAAGAELIARAPCPLLTVQPWVGPPRRSSNAAVVGVDSGVDSWAAAHAAAVLLRGSGPSARLILARGSDLHPSQRASRTRRDQGESLSWLDALRSELAGRGLSVEIVVRVAWAPDLVAGLAQKEDAAFTALGVQRRCEGEAITLGPIVQRVLRGTPCPLLTTCSGDS